MTPYAVLDALLDPHELVLLADCYKQLTRHQTPDLQCCGCSCCKLALASAANNAAAALPAGSQQFSITSQIHCSTSIMLSRCWAWHPRLYRCCSSQHVHARSCDSDMHWPVNALPVPTKAVRSRGAEHNKLAHQGNAGADKVAVCTSETSSPPVPSGNAL